MVESNDDRGWVRPLEGEPGTMEVGPVGAPSRSRVSQFGAGLIIALVIVAAVAVAAIWRGRNGDPFGSARSIPAGMDYVVTLDALALSDEARLQAFVDAFTAPMHNAGLIAQRPADLVALIDQALGEEIGFTLTDDILPWIGRSVSIGGTIPDFASYELDVSLIVAADVRDQDAAARFVDKVMRRIATEGGVLRPVDIGGVPGYQLGEDGDIEIGALVLTDGALLVGTRDDVAAAIEARGSGRAIADQATYVDALSRLPADRMVSFYLSGDVLESLAAMSAPEARAGTVGVTAMAMSAGLVDAGLQFSYVVIGDDVVSDMVRPDRDAVAALPADTLGFFSVAGSAGADGALFDAGLLDGLAYPIEAFEYELGVDVEAVIRSLSGDFTLAVTETRDSVIARETEVPVGLVGVIGLADPDPISEVLVTMAELLTEQGITPQASGDVTSFGVAGEEFISYSLRDDELVIGTGADLVDQVGSGHDGELLDAPLYQELDRAVAGDGLLGYVDIARIVRLVPLTVDEAAVVAPLRGVGYGATVDGEAALVEVLVLVDY